MANVFISHAGADTGWAEQIHQWLWEDGHKVFLDSDKDDGIVAGDEWGARLYNGTEVGRRGDLCCHAAVPDVGLVRGGDRCRAGVGQRDSACPFLIRAVRRHRC